MTGLPQSDPRLELALRRASNRFLGETNRLDQGFLAAPRLETYNDGGPAILLRGAPVVSVTSVSAGTTVLDAAAGDYTVDTEAGVLRLGGAWWQAPRTGELAAVVVDYVAGYEKVPGDVEDAVLEHAATIAMVMAHLQQESGGNTSQSFGKEAMVGTTAKWVTAVHKYNLEER